MEKLKRTASVKYTWNKYTREEKKDAQGNVIRDANGNIEYTDWKWADSGTEWGTKTKYANEILYPNVVSTLTADQISTGTTSASGESESGHSNKSGNSTTKYEWSSTTYSYSISKIYGGEANGETATKGFVYKSIDEGWYYDRNFCFYNPRLILHQAVYGKTYAFSYIAGEVDEGSISEGQYVVRIPRDFEHPPEFSEIGSQESAKGWGDAQENFNEIKGNLQSFVSFEGVGVGDIYKYGTLEANEHVALPHLKIAEAFGGNVWKESVGVKG